MLEEDYEYVGWSGDDECLYSDTFKTTVKVGGYTNVTPSDVSQMKSALALQPISVSLQAN